MHQSLRYLAVAIVIAATAFAQRGPGVQTGTSSRVSPHETISVNINNKVIVLTYGRPFTKSQAGEIRKVWALDSFVPSPWRLGADEATTLLTPAPLAFGNVIIPPGTYTLYMNYTNTSAELVFSRNVGKWGIPVDTTMDVAKVPLERSALAPANDQLVLAFEAGAAAADPVVLKIMWDTRQYSAKFTVQNKWTPRRASLQAGASVTQFVFYALVVVLGILSMGFQLLGSRLLAPHFGSSIIVWAWLISTFLLAFSLGSMLGGWISSRERSRQQNLQIIAAVLAMAGFAFTAFYGRQILDRIEVGFPAPETGNGIPTAALFVSCLGLFFIPVTMLSAFGPQCVQFLAVRGTAPGAASGIVYGVSTVGNIGGVMLTAFALIPHVGVSILLYLWLGVGVVTLSSLILLLRTNPKMPPA